MDKLARAKCLSSIPNLFGTKQVYTAAACIIWAKQAIVRPPLQAACFGQTKLSQRRVFIASVHKEGIAARASRIAFSIKMKPIRAAVSMPMPERMSRLVLPQERRNRPSPIALFGAI